MIPQWHRGSEWAVAHAKRFRDAVRERAEAGIGIAAQEKIRLMWIGAGLWHDTSFYQALEEKLGAVFVWSMYLPFAGAQYIRELKGRPLDALASRICSMNEVLHLPPWMNEWMVSEARRSGIDAAVLLMPKDNRLSQSGTILTAAALRSAGVPVLMLDADMVNAAQWDRGSAVNQVANFLASEVRRLAATAHRGCGAWSPCCLAWRCWLACCRWLRARPRSRTVSPSWCTPRRTVRRIPSAAPTSAG